MRAGLACLIALALSTRSCSREEGGKLDAIVDGEPPEGSPLVRGTGGGGVRVKDEVVEEGVEVRGWLAMAAAKMAFEAGSPKAPPLVRRSLKIENK